MITKFDIYPSKAQFITGEDIKVCYEISSDLSKKVLLQISVFFLDECIETKRQWIEADGTGEINLSKQNADFIGLGIDASIFVEEREIAYTNTAVDIVRNHHDAIRYGFLSDFSPGDESNGESLVWLNKLHVNYIQFYDWMYRHDDLIPRMDLFQDLMNRTLSRKTIHARMKQATRLGMQNIAYGAIYGATPEFFEQHPSWGLYDALGQPVTFYSFLNIMNINDKSGWHSYIINQYKKAIEFGFDGIHMDTYGFPKSGFSDKGDHYELAQEFPVLIDHTKEKLKEIKPDVSVIFNNVGNWPVDTVANAKQDALYIEVWDPYSNYTHIREIIKDAKASLNRKKPIILAAYLKPFQGNHIKDAESAALLLTAIITVQGASHLLLGENKGVLTEGYYPNYYKSADNTFNHKIRKYYDFIVRFMNIWFNDQLREVSFTHYQGDNKEYQIEGVACGPSPQPRKLWVTIKENNDLKVLSFINLLGAKDIQWNKEKQIIFSPSFKLMVRIDQNVQNIFFISPDRDNRIIPLRYQTKSDERGEFIELTVPCIDIWGTVLIKNSKI